MSKGKKKNDHHKKYDRVEQRKHFFEKIKWVCSLAGRPDAYQMMPRQTLELLYKLRALPFRIMAAPGEQIQETVLKKMRDILPFALKKQKVPLLENKRDYGRRIPLRCQ